MLRKIFRTGTNIVVSIPKDILDELDLSEGDDLSVELDSQQRQVDELIKEYRPALEALAKWRSI